MIDLEASYTAVSITIWHFTTYDCMSPNDKENVKKTSNIKMNMNNCSKE